jgi:hypothetical protein
MEALFPQIEYRLGHEGLQLFNEDWGPAEDLPSLSREEFLARMVLESVTVGDDGSLEFFFNDSDCFAGHYVEFYCSGDGVLNGPNVFG